MLNQLPIDLVFKVLDNLTIVETESFIDNLNQIIHVSDMDRKLINEMVIIAYQRIYRGKFTVYSNLDSHNPSSFDKAMKFEEFHRVLNERGGESTNPSGGGDNDTIGPTATDPISADSIPTPAIQNLTFRSTRSRFIEFVFIRQPNDYTQFVSDLNDFSRMIEHKETNLFTYLDAVLQYGLYINGNCIAIEPTTSFLVSILKVLISISSESQCLGQKFTRVTIKSTDIGQYYITQWCKLFSRFTNTQYLDLSDNLIKLDDNVYESSPSVDRDLLGSHFEWPPNLTYLNLNKNFITDISSKFIKNLPDTLKILILSNNWLTTIGQDHSESGPDSNSFNLFTNLPNLNILSLSYNNRLVHINPAIFLTINKCFKTLIIRSCSVSNDNITELGLVAKKHSFIIEI